MKYNLLWFLSIGNKFFKVTPGIAVSSIVLTLMSRFTFLLVSFLPLKVVILLGSEQVPNYFLGSLQDFGRNGLIIGLTLSTVCLYLIYLVFEKLLVFLTIKGGKRLLTHSGKMTLFDNQSAIAEKAYQRYSESLAHLLFILLTLVILFSFYPSVGFVLIIFGFVSFFLVEGLANWALPNLRQRLESDFVAVISVFTSIGFLTSFIFIVYQSMYGYGPSIPAAIISLLLIRQSLVNLNSVANHICVLVSQRVRVNALFFHEKQFVSESKAQDVPFWSLAEQGRAEKWVGEVIIGLEGDEPNTLSVAWFELGIKDIIALRVTVTGAREHKKEYLLKLFGKKQTFAAKQEIELLTEVSGLPSLDLLGVDEVEGFQCLVFEWIDGTGKKKEEVDDLKFEFNLALMSVHLPVHYVEKYQRSHPMLYQRLDNQFWKKVEYVSQLQYDDFPDIKLLSRNKDRINSRLSSLPKVIINTAITEHKLLKREPGMLVLLHWSGWAIEPVGANLSGRAIARVGASTAKGKFLRIDQEQVTIKDLRLAALMFSFEKLIKNNQFKQAFSMAGEILMCVEPTSL